MVDRVVKELVSVRKDTLFQSTVKGLRLECLAAQRGIVQPRGGFVSAFQASGRIRGRYLGLRSLDSLQPRLSHGGPSALRLSAVHGHFLFESCLLNPPIDAKANLSCRAFRVSRGLTAR